MKKTKKLPLKTQTIRSLTPSQLDQTHGGIDPTVTTALTVLGSQKPSNSDGISCQQC